MEGAPIGAIIANEKIASAMGEGDHFSTIGGNPVSCAAPIAVHNITKREQLVEKARELGEYAIML